MSTINLSDFAFLLESAGVTILLSFLSLILGSVLGVVVGVIRTFRIPVLDHVLIMLSDVVRGTPLLFQILLGYYGLAMIGFEMSPFNSALAVLGVRCSAQIAEITMAAINSVESGQWMAARSIGMTYLQTMRHVVVGQAIRVALPPYANTLTGIVKDSSIASVVGFIELTRAAAIVTARTYDALTLYGAASVLYFVICYSLSNLSLVCERKLRV